MQTLEGEWARINAEIVKGKEVEVRSDVCVCVCVCVCACARVHAHTCGRAEDRALAQPPRRLKVLKLVEHRSIPSFIHSFTNEQLPGCAAGAGEEP